MISTIIITATSLFSSVSGMSVNSSADFAYNTELNNDVINTQTVYRKDDSGKLLSCHLKYHFVYDAQTRLTQKEVLKWNADTNKWENDHCLNYQYTESGYTVELVRWNAKTDTYCDVTEKTVYEQNTATLATSYRNYTWNERVADWKLVTEHATLDLSGILFAMQK